MSSDRYWKAAVTNVEGELKKKGLRLPSNCVTPLKNGYRPEMDVKPELKSDGLQYYQELIGILRWYVEIGRLDILLEVSLMSAHLALARKVHLEQVIHIFGYIKSHSKFRIMFDLDEPNIDKKGSNYTIGLTFIRMQRNQFLLTFQKPGEFQCPHQYLYILI